jgi:RimJ/RimL family protein N-acetyltransferase
VTASFGIPPLTREELDARLQEALSPSWAAGDFGFFRLVLRDSGDDVGFGGIAPVDNEPGVGDIGYAFKPMFWGQGFASESVPVWIRWGFTALKLEALIANVTASHASAHILEKSGFIVIKDDGGPKRLLLSRPSETITV